MAYGVTRLFTKHGCKREVRQGRDKYAKQDRSGLPISQLYPAHPPFLSRHAPTSHP
nr:hypothetical protein Q903MT_gene2630 [Picea sitchensis]